METKEINELKDMEIQENLLIKQYLDEMKYEKNIKTQEAKSQ